MVVGRLAEVDLGDVADGGGELLEQVAPQGGMIHLLTGRRRLRGVLVRLELVELRHAGVELRPERGRDGDTDDGGVGVEESLNAPPASRG